MKNTITLELSADLQAKLDAILALQERIDKVLAKIEGDNLTVMQDDQAILEAAKAEHPVIDPFPEPVEPATEPEPEPPTPAYTKDDVQALVQKLAAASSDKREAAKAIVKSYAEKVSDLPAEKYPEIMDKLRELERAEV